MHTRLRVGQAFDNGDEEEGRPASLHIRRTHSNIPRFSTYLLRLQALEPVLGLLLPEDDEGPAVLVKDQRHGCVLKAAGSFFSSSKFMFFASFRWGLAGGPLPVRVVGEGEWGNQHTTSIKSRAWCWCRWGLKCCLCPGRENMKYEARS